VNIHKIVELVKYKIYWVAHYWSQYTGIAEVVNVNVTVKHNLNLTCTSDLLTLSVDCERQ